MARGRKQTKRRASTSSEPHEQPQGEVRRSQMLTSYGPGSLIDLVDHAVLVGGMDYWHWAGEPESIPEPRLRDALLAKFADLDTQPPRQLDPIRPFVVPPTGGEPAMRTRGVEVLLFPRWFVCKSCRALVGYKGVLDQKGRHVHECGGRITGDAIPVRFIGMCAGGHVQDYPWLAFVHEMKGLPRCSNPQLRFDEGSSGDFSDIRVHCECRASRKLSEAMAPEAGPSCMGERPWLGREGTQKGCENKLRLQVRTASNGYFAQVVSALSIPELDSGIEQAVESIKTLIAEVRDVGALAMLRQLVPPVREQLKGHSDEDVMAELERVRSGKPTPRDKLRVAEFKRFIAADEEKPGDLPKRSDNFFVKRIRPPEPLPTGVDSIVVAHALREVRVQVGFTRIEPAAPNLEGEYDLGVAVQPLGLHNHSLPAIEVRGEGIFVRLHETAVARWEALPAVVRRNEQLQVGWAAWKNGNFPTAKLEYPGARFYLVHSLAHLLISAISLDCGYAASAIRERIYCAPEDAELPMAALLLSTGTAGSEGTLGGLVEQGWRIRAHLRRAWELGTLCSNDPLCAGHSPADDHAERHLEGAACHGCLFVAEPSCERNNGFLDRALVVPTIGHPRELAFFVDRP